MLRPMSATGGPPEIRAKADPRDYLAGERTLLAWVRTGLALMGFGFVVARFGLFVNEIEAMAPTLRSRSYGLSLWFGTALIVAGVVATALAGVHHARLVRELDRGDVSTARRSTAALVLAGFLALVGVAMAIYLFSVRGSTRAPAAKGEETSMTENGIITLPGHHTVDETVDKIKTILAAKGVTLFAVIDHSGEAQKVGLDMRPTKLLIFGNPKAGTPLMVAAPSSAIDLPLKILVAEDAGGNVLVSYNSSAYLGQRHGLPAALLANIAVVETLAAKAVE